MDLRHPYLNEQLIAYIGNKRALLPFLHGVFSRLADGSAEVTFSDPFAGSGSVSRLARLMGFSVLANDWERYAFAINSCYIGVSESELAGLFRCRGGLHAMLKELSALPTPAAEKRYIARHFAPQNTAEGDWRRDRLFYTAENALFIDAVRERIEELYPGIPPDETAFKEKMVLLGPLLYEAATHTNTSGVFKAYHRGFGGHGKDALKRIMAPIAMRPPVLVDSPRPSRVFCEDARRFVASNGSDICYLDPPYAGHQYGSNYFMLTTIALWDKPDVSSQRTADGRFREKAGIRKDWVTTRSDFCSPASAPAAFRALAAAADCRFLCVSYSDEGIVGVEELADILAETGSLTVHARDYVKYPGGKQSIGRTVRNLELLFVVDRRLKAGPARRGRLEELMLEAGLERLLRSSFHPDRIRKAFAVEGNAIAIQIGGHEPLLLPMCGFYRFLEPERSLRLVSRRAREAVIAALSPCRVTDRREEIDVLIRLIAGGADASLQRRFFRDILRLLGSFAHRKYRAVFAETLERLKGFAREHAVPASFLEGLSKIEGTAALRFGHQPKQSG